MKSHITRKCLVSPYDISSKYEDYGLKNPKFALDKLEVCYTWYKGERTTMVSPGTPSHIEIESFEGEDLFKKHIGYDEGNLISLCYEDLTKNCKEYKNWLNNQLYCFSTYI